MEERPLGAWKKVKMWEHVRQVEREKEKDSEHVDDLPGNK